MNGSRSLITEIRSELSDTRSNDSKVRNTVLCTLLYNTNPKSEKKHVRGDHMARKSRYVHPSTWQLWSRCCSACVWG
ncbi:hypothetical protein RHMOL_Rhmol02G0144500 [Rhododendron molle]|nr:hypothetical protein RHMOL_Rhmol02G0144500 [Rhododendron molle]